MSNIRHASRLRAAGAASGIVVLAAQMIGHVPVAEASHLGFVQLGHITAADATTEVDNTAPAGRDGRALHVRASPAAGGVGLKAVGHGGFGVGALAYSYDAEGVVGIALPFSGSATNGVTGESGNPMPAESLV